MSKTLINTDDFKSFYENAYLLIPLTDDDYDERLKELEGLAETAGAKVVGVTYQKIRVITPSTYMGEGKLNEIAETVKELKTDLIIFDGQLSPSQAQNISDIFGVKVIDRTALILDIFALHALTTEGKLQVELAQLEYIYPRLKGKGSFLSRLGGGIGTRGPGETQLETDRRHIRQRINSIKSALSEIETRRNLQISRRNKNQAFTIAIAGYTNAGKSTLLNTISGSNVLAEDKLFATLDTTARKVDINGISAIVIDTVGFIKDIPTSLIKAFKSTLESAVNADLILSVADISDNYEKQFEVTEKTLRELRCSSPIIKVLNKCDKIDNFDNYPKDVCFISASENLGIESLKRTISDAIKKEYSTITIIIPYDKIKDFYSVSDFAESYETNYNDDGISVRLTVKNIYKDKFSEFI